MLKYLYSLILGNWAASIGAVAAIIVGDRHQSTSQKVCQDFFGRLFKLVCGCRD